MLFCTCWREFVDISRNKNNSRAPAAIGRLISCRRPGVSYASSISEIFVPSRHVRPLVQTLARINSACNEKNPVDRGAPILAKEGSLKKRRKVVHAWERRRSIQYSTWIKQVPWSLTWLRDCFSIMRENYYFARFFFWRMIILSIILSSISWSLRKMLNSISNSKSFGNNPRSPFIECPNFFLFFLQSTLLFPSRNSVPGIKYFLLPLYSPLLKVEWKW